MQTANLEGRIPPVCPPSTREAWRGHVIVREDRVNVGRFQTRSTHTQCRRDLRSLISWTTSSACFPWGWTSLTHIRWLSLGVLFTFCWHLKLNLRIMRGNPVGPGSRGALQIEDACSACNALATKCIRLTGCGRSEFRMLVPLQSRAPRRSREKRSMITPADERRA